MATFVYPLQQVTITGVATEATALLELAQLQAINTNTAAGATQATLAALNAKVTAVNTGAVVVSSSALPAGAATSANQATEIASLSSIDTKLSSQATAAKQDTAQTSLSSIDTKLSSQATAAKQDTQTTALQSMDTKTPALGQALAAASVPVVLTAAQLSTLTPLTGGATETTQLANGVLLGAVTETAPVSDTASSGLNGRLQRIAQRITSLIALIPASLGQKTAANSLAVTIASDQSALTVATTDATASGNITTQNLNPNSGTATASSTVAINLSGQNTISVQVTGTYTGALTPQVTVDGTNWIALSATSITNTNTNAQAATIASATVGIFEISAPPAAQFRISALAAVTGTAVVSIRATAVAGRVGLDSPIPAGTAIIGALSANQSVNVAQINGVAATMGNGASGTGVQRVTIASDSTGQLKLAGKTAVNKVRNDYTSVNVTTAAYVQLLSAAAFTTACTEIEIFDSSGQTLLLATGAAASEVDQVYILPGGNGRIPLAIAASTRIAVKAASATASVGELTINFYG